ncbi:hypothetical protein [Granulicella sp. S190]|uniref:hypothetical protein n=1 Tax=Granulicella sp. S190 TaxID=1747226 RepID=UPI00131B359C|nr:hypothetical protein [Granulicella sp. S190]
MTAEKVDVLELIAWDLDDYAYRDASTGFSSAALDSNVEQARARLSQLQHYANNSALLEQETRNIQQLLTAAATDEDMQREYERLNWTLGVVDLRCLIAFQRRLIFSPVQEKPLLPKQDDWLGLISLSVGSRRSTRHELVHHHSESDRLDMSLHSSNPDLQLKFHPKTKDRDLLPFSLYGGSPFFEVAEFRGRWFLRDGYHRAYHLLQAGVHRLPAVVIYVRSIEELGATEPWFFSEQQLFSDRPPKVTDFLEDSMTLRYERTALRKVLRIRVEESLEPLDEIEERQGETR